MPPPIAGRRGMNGAYEARARGVTRLTSGVVVTTNAKGKAATRLPKGKGGKDNANNVC